MDTRSYLISRICIHGRHVEIQSGFQSLLFMGSTGSHQKYKVPPWRESKVYIFMSARESLYIGRTSRIQSIVPSQLVGSCKRSNWSRTYDLFTGRCYLPLRSGPTSYSNVLEKSPSKAPIRTVGMDGKSALTVYITEPLEHYTLSKSRAGNEHAVPIPVASRRSLPSFHVHFYDNSVQDMPT